MAEDQLLVGTYTDWGNVRWIHVLSLLMVFGILVITYG